MPNNAAIEIIDLYKTYAGSTYAALNGLSLTVAKGEFFGLLGPNGAGKTTTVSILCGLASFQKGNVFVEGQDVKTQTKNIKRITGVVPQEIALYQELTTEENLRLFGNMHNISGQSVRMRMNEFINDFGLMPYRNRRIEQLSGGMKRQVNLIAALLNSPSILFLDEPTVGIDVRSKSIIVEKLKQIHQNGTTVVYTSHDMNEAETLCSHIALLDRGKIIVEGHPVTLISKFGVGSVEELIRKYGWNETFESPLVK
ncbi:MAG: ABC transporter ATP-binding protein [Tannerella sp.]|jgi:ABC-2 type transport system ATP-binding protein|nr:ABC transporter ATP-binding protein [Tannerella sp.]